MYLARPAAARRADERVVPPVVARRRQTTFRVTRIRRLHHERINCRVADDETGRRVSPDIRGESPALPQEKQRSRGRRRQESRLIERWRGPAGSAGASPRRDVTAVRQTTKKTKKEEEEGAGRGPARRVGCPAQPPRSVTAIGPTATKRGAPRAPQRVASVAAAHVAVPAPPGM